jgi:16S rRNA (cytidine1402-2'-O)-methyltransferase
MPCLYVVATPIGNLEDISLRALRILGEVKLIAAEDTRRTRKLLNAYDISTRLTSYHEHNKMSKLGNILVHLETEDVALVSDAGMPGIADPGQELIAAASLKGIPVVPIPGPSAAITALAVSGLPTDRFSYIGFLPRKSGERRRLLETVRGEPGSIVCLETPHRLRAALEDILLVLGDRPVAVCRQLTKLHEEVFRGTVSGALKHFEKPRGEFVLVITGKTSEEKPQLTEAITEKLAGMHRSGQTARQAVTELAGETGLSKKELYRAWLRLT